MNQARKILGKTIMAQANLSSSRAQKGMRTISNQRGSLKNSYLKNSKYSALEEIDQLYSKHF